MIYSVDFLYAGTTFTTTEVCPAVFQKTAGLFLSTKFHSPPNKNIKYDTKFKVKISSAFALRQTHFFVSKIAEL